MRGVAITHVIATWFMVGMIWTIHLVHYPLFAKVGQSAYVEYQAAHVDRIGKLLVLPWLVEGLSLLGLMWFAFLGNERRLRIPVAIGAVAMAVVLVVTVGWSVPAHDDLAAGFDAAVHTRLMRANLVRTLAWSVRGISAVWILALLWPKQQTPLSDTPL